MEKEFQKSVRGIVPLTLWLDTKTRMHRVKHFKSGKERSQDHHKLSYSQSLHRAGKDLSSN